MENQVDLFVPGYNSTKSKNNPLLLLVFDIQYNTYRQTGPRFLSSDSLQEPPLKQYLSSQEDRCSQRSPVQASRHAHSGPAAARVQVPPLRHWSTQLSGSVRLLQIVPSHSSVHLSQHLHLSYSLLTFILGLGECN